MLHLIYQTPLENAVIQRIEIGDDVVFFETAVFRLNKAGLQSTELEQMLANNVHLYVLSDELAIRGVNTDELVSGITVIDYSGLVALTEKNEIIRTWN
jgi:sulfur relay protein TusB/DsrH